MKVRLYVTENSKETIIAEFPGLLSNPFNLNDVVGIDVKTKDALVLQEYCKRFDRRTFKLSGKRQFIDISANKPAELVIEYRCSEFKG